MSSDESDSLLEVFTTCWICMNVSILHIIYGVSRKMARKKKLCRINRVHIQKQDECVSIEGINLNIVMRLKQKVGWVRWQLKYHDQQRCVLAPC